MSRYIKLASNEYPRHPGDIRLEYPEMGKDFVLPETYAYVEWVDAPSYDDSLQCAEEVAPELVDGKWYMRWTIRDLTQEELDYISQHNTQSNMQQG
jgi:hypothetical protein